MQVRKNMTLLYSICCKLGFKCVFFHAESPLCPRSASASPLSACAHQATSPLLWALEGHHQHARYRPAQTRLHPCESFKTPFHSASFLYSIHPACYIIFCCDIRGGAKCIIHPHVHESINPSLNFPTCFVSCTRTALIFIMKHVNAALLT